MNYVWRFYSGDDSQWRWQKLSADQTLNCRVITKCNSHGHEGKHGTLSNPESSRPDDRDHAPRPGLTP